MRSPVIVLVKRPPKVTRGMSPMTRAMKLARRYDATSPSCIEARWNEVRAALWWNQDDKGFCSPLWPIDKRARASGQAINWDMADWPPDLPDEALPVVVTEEGVFGDMFMAHGLSETDEGKATDAADLAGTRNALEARRQGYWAVVVIVHF